MEIQRSILCSDKILYRSVLNRRVVKHPTNAVEINNISIEKTAVNNFFNTVPFKHSKNYKKDVDEKYTLFLRSKV